MDYALLHGIGTKYRSWCKAETTMVADSAGSSLCGAAISAVVCAGYACAVGISIFLLVPVCLGGSCIGFDVCGVPKD
jgi:hypothetical protein